MRILTAFLAGFLSTLVFHQGLLAILHGAGATPLAPYAMTPVPPFQVPQVVSLAFWGGVWGVLLWLMIRPLGGSWLYWVSALVLGALAPTIVALFVVFPLKGKPVAGGWQPALIVGALMLNGAWGIGTALFLRLFGGLFGAVAGRR
jgi:hypothetical protein